MGFGDGFAGKRCLLTGAASGIGRATALKLAAQGAELYLTDRNADGLAATVSDARALGAVVAAHRALDITDLDAVTAFATDIHTAHGAMDVVMNIAGVSAWGTVSKLTHQHWKSMIDVNLMGPIHVIETFVPPMVAAGRGGHLVNVSSAAGLVALPWHAAYSASKYGLRGLSEVLRFDLARHRILALLHDLEQRIEPLRAHLDQDSWEAGWAAPRAGPSSSRAASAARLDSTSAASATSWPRKAWIAGQRATASSTTGSLPRW